MSWYDLDERLFKIEGQITNLLDLLTNWEVIGDADLNVNTMCESVVAQTS